MHACMHVWMDGFMDLRIWMNLDRCRWMWVGGWVGGWVDARMHGFMEMCVCVAEWMDGHTETWMRVCAYLYTYTYVIHVCKHRLIYPYIFV